MKSRILSIAGALMGITLLAAASGCSVGPTEGEVLESDIDLSKINNVSPSSESSTQRKRREQSRRSQ